MYRFNDSTSPNITIDDGLGWFQDDNYDDMHELHLAPEKCPMNFGGALLLPKIRSQDQTMEPIMSQVNPGFVDPLTTDSLNVYPHGSRPTMLRRSHSPPYQSHLASPVSMVSDFSPPVTASFETPSRPSMAHRRTVSTSSVRTHSRNVSASTVSEDDIRRFGYPTQYRAASASAPFTPAAKGSSALDFLTPISALSSGSLRTPPTTVSVSRSRNPSPSARPSRLSAELVYDSSADLEPTSTLLEYLTMPNPTPSLVAQKFEHSRQTDTHFWYDIRNLRSWSSFNVSTIAAIEGLLPLLQCPVNASALATPARVNTNLENPMQLHDICRMFHSVKVNAALKIAQGERHMAMRSLISGRRDRQQPEFVSNYLNDNDPAVLGQGRGRVMGIVRCFDEWNTGMRSESALHKIRYLQGLSDLHKFMRENGCRYGFIMTEIELVCVRCGGDPDENGVPYFGFLELSAPIKMATHGIRTADEMATDGANSAGGIQMTATLALFYLHMLAKELPLPGQYGWKMEIGAPIAATRKRHLATDDWMPKPSVKEKRDAKHRRGWVWPSESFSKREAPKHKRNSSRR